MIGCLPCLGINKTVYRGISSRPDLHLCAKLKLTNLKKMHKFMGHLDIHFFFISNIFIIWTWQIHEWEDISKPSNIHNIIKLFTVLHIVAKQPIK